MRNDMRLLVDGDIVVYTACLACEEAIDWGEDVWTLHCFFDQVCNVIDNELHDLIDASGQTHGEIEVFISSKSNFRKDVCDTYKSNRKGGRKPICFNEARAYAKEKWQAIEIHNIEADDAIGIAATLDPDNTIIVSQDKDLKTVPGSHWDFQEQKIYWIDPLDAEFYHLKQTLTGDKTDGYTGCPGVGPVKADAILQKADDDGTSRWQAVVKAFDSKGYNEEFALQQARLAYILQAPQFKYPKLVDGMTVEPILWTPND